MKKKKEGFTLVELLAVIVILAVILVIAIPQIMNVIKTSRLSSIKDSAMLIAEQADKDYLSQQVLNPEYNATSIPCSDVAKLNDDYASCNITYNNGIATVKLKGKDGGKFSGITCKGTKDSMECREVRLLANNESVETYLANLLEEETTTTACSGTGKLIEVPHENGDVDYRYVGSCPNNYVYFNCSDPDNPTSDTCEMWRIIGLFDVSKSLTGTKEKRIKLIRNLAIGHFSWDTSELGINSGYGINEWSQADLKAELNGDYLNSRLSSDTKWYNGQNNQKTAVFRHNYVLKASAQSLIDYAVWYTGASSTGVSLSTQYSNERGNATGKICRWSNNCNDSVTRTTSWVGKVGLIYPSDYAYASEDTTCKNNINQLACNKKNWLYKGNYINWWTITPSNYSSTAYHVEYVVNGRVAGDVAWDDLDYVYPSVYLKSGLKVSGKGTEDNPYVFSK